MPLTKDQLKALKKRVHHLKPVVMVGQHGLTEGVLEELEQALQSHELIKVRLSGADREEKRAMQREICRRTGAEFVNDIGHVAAFYRPNPDQPKIELPA